ncbi:MAG: 7-carboxy-7-deazaguanine synthase QueE [Caldimicrobium sp.]
MSLKISEIFFSIQGEGPFIGYPTLFIRLYGCNLNCSWCDTPYAKSGSNFVEKSIKEIIIFWQKNYFEIPFITITGGEPLLQKESLALMEDLIKEGAVVSLETNGSLSIKDVPKDVVIIMDIKTPSSQMSHFNNYNNFNFLQKKDVVKFIIQDKKDFDWSLEIIERYDLLSRVNCLFSPVYGKMSPHELSNWILMTKKPIRFQIQLHKLLNLK